MKTKKSVFRRAVFFLCLLGSNMLLSGCESPKRTTTGKHQTPAVQAFGQSPAEREAAQLARCQKELDALKPVNPQQYQTYQQAFGQLMSGAAQYANVRTQASSGTQEAVDSLYRYKAKRLCADISLALLTSLADIGERVK